MLTRDITSRAILAERDPEPELHRCTCPVPDRMTETPDDAAMCAYCGGLIVRPIVRPGTIPVPPTIHAANAANATAGTAARED